MLYLAIDQHSKQITVSVRDEDGNTVLSPSSQKTQTTNLFFDNWISQRLHRKLGRRDPSMLWSTLSQRPNRLVFGQDWRGFESATMDLLRGVAVVIFQ
jgi:hypothetical protein